MYNEPLTLLTEQAEIVEYLNKNDYEVTNVNTVNKKIYGLKRMLEENKNVKLGYFNPEDDENYQEFLKEHFPSIKSNVEEKVNDELMEKVATTVIDDNSDIDEEDLFYQIEYGVNFQ